VVRIISPGVSKELGQQIVVDYRAGASGNIGVEVVARAPADGYMLLLAASAHGYQPAVFPSSRSAPCETCGVTLVGDVPTAWRSIHRCR